MTADFEKTDLRDRYEGLPPNNLPRCVAVIPLSSTD